jgi:NADH-quinone oxidoreductase subunit C
MIPSKNISDLIEARFPGGVSEYQEDYGILTMVTDRKCIWNLLQFVRDEPTLQFNFLTDLCGIHVPTQKGRELGVVYHLHSWMTATRLRVKTFFPQDDPRMPTVTTLWPTANWMERETYDFFGIHFEGHPNLHRILNVEELTVFPLRKEYRLEDATRTDKEDQFFGRTGNYEQRFDQR